MTAKRPGGRLPKLPRSRLRKVPPPPASRVLPRRPQRQRPQFRRPRPRFRRPRPRAPRPSWAPPGYIGLKLPKPCPSLSNRLAAGTGRGKREALLRPPGGRARAASFGTARCGAFGASRSPWKQATPRPPRPVVPECAGARAAPRMRSAARARQPRSRRQLRRCRCHYGPLQSEGGAARLGACGRWRASGRLRVGVGVRAQILGA